MASIQCIACPVEEIGHWRELYRQEMNCQIVHDSFCARPGWVRAWQFFVDGVAVGYGSLVVAGPWQNAPTVYEMFVLPHFRCHAFTLFETLLSASQPVGIEVQSNDSLITVMLHAYAREIKTQSILFHDCRTTSLAVSSATIRRLENTEGFAEAGEWIAEVDGEIAAKGGVLFHYNRPYGDIYMEVAENFRRRGLGSYLVQELKRVAYQSGNVPAARCNPANLASRRTLQKAGFAPYANLLAGDL
ncbi:GNAT family N-acetyltransferase [Lacipirellula sp.]|uniref:GNAT family N-acetyltransferase n=1 Tax=Lacipirellula sp. TaxID=2691419 RepID=UPI003D10F64F